MKTNNISLPYTMSSNSTYDLPHFLSSPGNRHIRSDSGSEQCAFVFQFGVGLPVPRLGQAWNYCISRPGQEHQRMRPSLSPGQGKEFQHLGFDTANTGCIKRVPPPFWPPNLSGQLIVCIFKSFAFTTATNTTSQLTTCKTSVIDLKKL